MGGSEFTNTNISKFSESMRDTSVVSDKRENTEASSYISNRKSMGNKKKKSDKNESIDEVRALEDLFYSFFGSQAKSSQKNVLVEMSRHECSPNPFYVPKPPKDRNQSNILIAEGEDDQFSALKKRNEPRMDEIKEEFSAEMEFQRNLPKLKPIPS